MGKPGQNVWYDLVTSDVAGALRFYSETIGWKTDAWKDAQPGNDYTMWVAVDHPIGGVVKLPPEAKGMPPHWMAYTEVDKVDDTLAQAQKLGAKVLQPPFDIPKVGRIAVLADPQGAAFAIFTPSEPWPDQPRSGPGEFSWSELNTTDYEGAWKFYSQLFGWKHTSSHDMGPMGTYFMWNDPSQVTKGGMSNVAKSMNMPPHWLHYVTVDNIDAAVDRIKSKGGKVLNGPMQVPGGDFIAQCTDPQGGFFAIFASGKNA